MQLSELKKAMKGVQIILMTPFNKDESLDLEGMRANIRWLLERTAGKDFFFTPTGSNGELYAMSDDEGKAVIKMVAEEVKGQHVVMVGAGRAATRETIKMCQYAESVGADAAMVIIPYYLIPTEEGMYQHYKQLAGSVGKDFGIQIYNNPFVSGSWIKPHLMARISKIPNVIATKESTPYIMRYYAMQRAVDPKDTVIIGGSSELLFSFQAVYGCAGFISARANFMPDLSYSLYKAAAARDFDKVAELVDSLAPLASFADKVVANHGPDTHTGAPGETYMGLAVMKASMDIVGLRGGEVRLPLVGLSEEEKAELRDVLRTMKVIK